MVWSLSERERKSLAYCRRQFLLQTDSWILHEKMTKLHTYLHSYSFRFGGRKKNKYTYIHFFFWVKTLMNHVTGTKWLASRCNSFYLEKYNDFSYKAHIFWECHKLFRNLHFTFDWRWLVKISQNIWTLLLLVSNLWNPL